MQTLLFPDHQSRDRALRLAARPGEGARTTTPVLWEHDLVLSPPPGATEDDLHAVWRETVEDLDAVTQLLPPALTRAPEPGVPSLWDCYGEHFRAGSIAPLAANVFLTRRAAENSGATEAVVLENPRSGGWWTGRQQVLEAVQAGLEGTRTHITARPGATLRAVRALALACGGAWLAGGVQILGGRRALELRRRRAALPTPGPADVLFLPVGSTSVPILDRLAERLRDAHSLSCAAVMLDPSDLGMEARAQSGIPYHYMDGFRPPLEALKRHWEVLFRWPGWYTAACRAARRDDPGPLWPGIRRRLLVALARDSQQMLADITAAGRILDVIRPRVVVTLHLYWHRIAPVVLAARGRGIPTVYLQHGVYLAKDDLTRPLPYDEFLVFGDAAKETLRRRLPDAPISAVGHCLYDDLLSGPLPTQPPPGTDHPPVVVIATQPDEVHVSDVHSADWWVRKVVEAGRDLGAQTVIKLHPQDRDAGMYEAVVRDMPGAARVMPHGERPLLELLAGAHALVTRDSTVVIEANLLGVPVITINFTGRGDRFPFARDGGACGVYQPEEVLPALRRCMEGFAAEDTARREAFIRRHCGPADGRATERVAGTIARHAAQAQPT